MNVLVIWVALYESVVPGIPADRSGPSQLNEMPALPQVVCGEKYFIPLVPTLPLASTVQRHAW